MPKKQAKKGSKKKNLVKTIQEGVKKAAKKTKEKLKITYNRSKRIWERPKYMRKAEFERQLAEKEAIYVRRKSRDVSKLFEEVSARYSTIKSEGLQSDAIMKFEKEMPEGLWYSKDMEKSELLKQIQVARSFLSNPTSTLEGAKAYTGEISAFTWRAEHQYLGEDDIGSQSFNDYNNRLITLAGKQYLTTNDIASAAFSAYREAMRAGLANAGMYDSENMITYAFSVVEENAYENNENDRTEIIKRLFEYVETQEALRNTEYEMAFKYSEAASAIIEEDLENLFTRTERSRVYGV